MANTTTFQKRLIKGRFKYTQVLASNVAGAIPTPEELPAGFLAINIPDQTLYTANDTTVFAISVLDFDVNLLVSNAYAIVTFPTFTYVNSNFIANTAGNAAVIPVGNNTNRPSPASNGYFRYNTEVESFEGFVDGNWIFINNPGGPNGAVQFNDSEIFEGSAGFLFDKTTNNIIIANTTNSAIFVSGNSTANIFANSILFKVANSTGVANLQPGLLSIGICFINTSFIGIGANLAMTEALLAIGNSTVSIITNPTLFSIKSGSAFANIDATSLRIGASIVNADAVSVGGTGAMVINSTSYAAGANVLLDAVRLFIGNSTVNATMNSTAFALNGVPVGGGGGTPGGANTHVQFNDSTAFGGTAGFTFDKTTNNVVIANTLTIGGSVVNTTAYAAGANVFLNTTRLFLGNTTVNCSINSSSIFINGLQVAIVPTIQVFTANGTWTRPTNCKKVKVTVVGGGGGGGAGTAVPGCCTVNPGFGGGGGGGGTAIKFLDVTAIGSASVTVPPAAGTGATGGTVSFDSHASATGGAAGAGGSGVSGAGGAGGVGSSGDVNATGGTGDGGGAGTSGRGGSTIFSGEGMPATSNSVGGAAQGYGAGGGGGTRTGLAGTNDGGAGKIGIVIVEEYY